MDNMDINGMAAESPSTMEVVVMKWSFKHSMRYGGCSARMKLGKRKLVRYNNGSDFYNNLYKRQQEVSIFDGSTILVSVNDIQT